MAKRAKTPTQLSYVTSSYAPGYRDLTLILTDNAGNNYELRLPPGKVQTLIYACADVVKQIGVPHPPIDWDQYRAQINWPAVTPWMNGPAKEDRRAESAATREHDYEPRLGRIGEDA